MGDLTFWGLWEGFPEEAPFQLSLKEECSDLGEAVVRCGEELYSQREECVTSLEAERVWRIQGVTTAQLTFAELLLCTRHYSKFFKQI